MHLSIENLIGIIVLVLSPGIQHHLKLRRNIKDLSVSADLAIFGKRPRLHFLPVSFIPSEQNLISTLRVPSNKRCPAKCQGVVFYY